MEQFDREDSSKYVNRPEETGNTVSPATPVASAPQKPKKSKAARWLALLLLLALVAAGVLGWMWYDQTERANAAEASVEKVRSEIANLKASQDKMLKNAETKVETMSNSDAIVAAALAYAKAPADSKSTQYLAEIVYNKDGFARVTLSSGQSGFTEVLKEVDDQWVVIVSGQSEPSQDDIKMYGIPQAVIDSYKM